MKISDSKARLKTMFKTIQSNNFVLAGYFSLICCLHVNAILKADDPIRDTQTEEILYEQKMEQEKDGVKAPATPKVIFYGGQGFLTRSSLSENDSGETKDPASKKKNIFNWSDWWDEKPAEENAPEAVETQGFELPGDDGLLLEKEAPSSQEKQPEEPLAEALDGFSAGSEESVPVADDAWW